MTIPDSLTAPLAPIRQAILENGGWIGFDRFMALALYNPGLGYYARDRTVFGAMPQDGSDFVTAPELSPLFGSTLARQVAQALHTTGTDELWEFGAGSGALAVQLLDALRAQGVTVRRYTIVELSASLRARQQATLQAHADTVCWVDALPPAMHGVVVGNEVLDAMPVQLLVRHHGVWHERGVAWGQEEAQHLVWHDQITPLRPPCEVPGTHDYLTEIHPQAQAFVHTLGERLQRGAVFLLDYGFPEAEYYHAQRHMGTVMCHRAHQSDSDPLRDVGHKDITAHVNFTGIALAAQDAGFDVLGYTNQAHFLLNCGLAEAMQTATRAQRVAAQRLILEHEMGELFKVIGLAKGAPWDALGFAQGDRTHRL